MTVPPINFKSILLAAQVTKVLNVIHRVAYALITPDLIVTYATPNFSTVLSEPSTPIIGQYLPKLLWEFVGVEENLKAVHSGTLPFLAFERINREQPDGHLTYLDLSVTPIQEPDLGQGLLLIVEDVTDQAQMEQRLTQHRNELLLVKRQLSKANEELEHLNKLKSLFLSMAAHDLRTPLATIRAYSDLTSRMLPADAPEKLKSFVHIIAAQTSRLDWLIDDFLDLDSIERGELNLALVPGDLNALVHEVVDMVKYLTDRRRQTLLLDLWPTTISLDLDPNRIRQVLYNLLSNAIKYTPRDGQINVSTWAEADSAVVQVIDTGPGMTDGQKAGAFQPYYRADDANTYDEHGMGLGLFIVKILTEAHDGHVELISEPDQGCTVRVFLPLQNEPPDSDE